jgi:undecaprenyl-diphosphatase
MIILVAGLALVAVLVEADGVAALDHPALDAAKAARTPQLTTLAQAFTTLGGPIGIPVLATVVAVGLGVAWRWPSWWRQPRSATVAGGRRDVFVVSASVGA